MAVSKNQRAGVRTKQRATLCSQGCEMKRVKYVPVFGRARFYWTCEHEPLGACNITK